MNAVILIVILFLGELCCGTLSPPARKNEKEKKKATNKVDIIKRDVLFSLSIYKYFFYFKYCTLSYTRVL